MSRPQIDQLDEPIGKVGCGSRHSILHAGPVVHRLIMVGEQSSISDLREIAGTLPITTTWHIVPLQAQSASVVSERSVRHIAPRVHMRPAEILNGAEGGIDKFT